MKPKPKKRPRKPVEASTLNPEVSISKSLMRAWEDTLIQFARFPRGTDRRALDRQQLIRTVIESEAEAVGKMWQVFNEERQSLGRYLSDPKRQAIAYMLGFHLPNLARNRVMWQRSGARYRRFFELFSNARSIIVNDLGCGTGAASLSCIDSFDAILNAEQRSNLRINLVDQRTAFLDIASAQLQRAFHLPEAQIRSVKLTVDAFESRGNADDLEVFCLGYLWNEIMRDTRSRRHLFQTFRQAALRPVVLAIGDSANQNISRELMELRNELVAANEYQVLYPCAHQAACPMLELGSDWCYSEGSWEMPVYQKRVDQLIGVRREVFGGTLQLYISRPLAQQMAELGRAMPNDAKIIVGRPVIKDTKHTKNRQSELLLCGHSGLSRRPAPPSLPRSRAFRGLAAP